LNTSSCSEYLIKVENTIQEEKSRTEEYLHYSTLPSLMNVIYEDLLKTHQKDLLEKDTGIVYLLDHLLIDCLNPSPKCNQSIEKAEIYPQSFFSESFEDYTSSSANGTQMNSSANNTQMNSSVNSTHMNSSECCSHLNRLCRLYGRIPIDLNPVATMCQDYIEKLGTKIIDRKDNSNLIKDLLTIHTKYDEIIKTCFYNLIIFKESLKGAFGKIINKCSDFSEQLASFIHSLLQKTSGSKCTPTQASQNRPMTQFDNIVRMYGYIQDKDIFEQHYQIFLSKRLLSNSSNSEQDEKSMLSKLRNESGYQWINKLEGMFKDIKISKELENKFETAVAVLKDGQFSIPKTTPEIKVTVCTTGVWPTALLQRDKSGFMPRELNDICGRYTRFYVNKYPGRKIKFAHDQGSADVSVQFSSKVNRTLTVSTYQMMILSVFNDIRLSDHCDPQSSHHCNDGSFGVVTTKQIRDITGIPNDELGNALLSLAHPKVGVLEKKPNDVTLNDNHKFRLNRSFTSKLLRISIPTLDLIKNVSRNLATQNEITKSHINMTDAAIVRIMKAHQQMNHNDLIIAVIEQLHCRFKVMSREVKKRIEYLIEQEYIQRDENDRSKYLYVV
jgi:hypothetical protein